jgi:hypothetical protein
MANEIEEALARLAPKLGGGTVSDLQRLSGGASAETWAFALEGPGGRREMILVAARGRRRTRRPRAR